MNYLRLHKQLTRIVTFSVTFFFSSVIHAAEPFDANANAVADIRAALAKSAENGKFVLLKFGANWCTDCLVLADQFKQQPLQGLIEDNFNVVKVDIGDEYEKNRDIQERYNNATERGIPTIVVLDQDNNILFGTLTGQLASARSMGKQEIYDFFTQVVSEANKITKEK